MSTFWRAAGLSYLQYVNAASAAVRGALKQPLKEKALARGQIHIRERAWAAGQGGDKSKSTNQNLHSIETTG